MGDPISNRRQLEELWRDRMREAELLLGLTRYRMKQVQRDFPRGEVPSPGGDLAFNNALRAENTALREYFDVLEIFTNLVLHGKIPDEVDWLRRKITDSDGSSR